MNRLFPITLGLATVAGLFALFFNLAGGLIVSPEALAIGLLLGAAYVVIVVFLLWLTPLWPQRAYLWVLPALIWGGGVCLSLVGVLATPVMDIPEKLGWDLVLASLGGAYPEEFLKALGVVIILLSFRRLNRPWHGLLAGAVVGLGFETMENLLYGINGAILDPNDDAIGALQLWALRLIVGPCLHIVFTSIAGWGIGVALYTAEMSPWRRVGSALGWFLVAFCFHFCWNLSPGNDVAQILNMIGVGLVMYPTFVWLLVRAWRQARRDDTYALTPKPLLSVAELSPQKLPQ
ncbi:PrsW family intramembrane metalloprotease [Corynebacterium lowii]|uniref:Protease PrsW n=1 Tax=Corynebacterium lowii TaxID=1544413 RepID=A0A0Q0YXP6_9CORY|nr:PrsW family intramembrane metalloprotease [Corynebacterium lowii]KQB87140.1 hypothetical protein Clow_00188 [Corynebacterium lowii]MDP9852274.1 RsiW-degrading membrane proteinase PrsW (M82 family) [Corynebacterium lowii]